MTRQWTSTLSFAKDVIKDFMDDDALSLAAAIAFYTALSFAPLVLLLLTVGGFFGDRTQNDLIRLFEQQLGPQAGDVTRSVIENAQRQGSERAGWRWVFGLGLLFVAASGVFGQLQASLNRVWDVVPKPTKGWRGWWLWLRKRLLSMGMVMAVLFILLASLVVAAMIQWVMPRLGAGEALGGRAAVAIASFLVVVLLFAAMFKFLPDVRVGWRYVWVGALITAVLFTVGKAVLSIYLKEGKVGADYGSATGGLIALLVWVYYSSTTLLLGAEVTQQYARRRGALVQPLPHAQWADSVRKGQADAQRQVAPARVSRLEA